VHLMSGRASHPEGTKFLRHPLDSLGVYLYVRGDRSVITAVEGVSQMAKKPVKPAKPEKKGKK